MAAKLPVEGLTLVLDRIVPVLLTPAGEGFQAPPEPLPHRPDVDREVPPTASLADMREAQEVERGRFLPPFPFRSRQGFPPELNQSSLVRVKSQSVLREPLGQHLQDFLRLLPVLKTENEVIGKSHFVGFPSQPGFHYLLEPCVKHMVKVDIR